MQKRHGNDFKSMGKHRDQFKINLGWKVWKRIRNDAKNYEKDRKG